MGDRYFTVNISASEKRSINHCDTGITDINGDKRLTHARKRGGGGSSSFPHHSRKFSKMHHIGNEDYERRIGGKNNSSGMKRRGGYSGFRGVSRKFPKIRPENIEVNVKSVGGKKLSHNGNKRGGGRGKSGFRPKNKIWKKKLEKKSKLNITNMPSFLQNCSNDSYLAKDIFRKSNNLSQIKGVIQYYAEVPKMLQEVKDSFRDSFISNVLSVSKDIEVELSCHSLISPSLQVLLDDCTDFQCMKRFLSAFASRKDIVFFDGSASYLTESLIHYTIRKLKDAQLQSEEEEISYLSDWLLDFGNFMQENLDKCLQNNFSCHVCSTLIQALGGDMNACNIVSKKLNSNEDIKKHFRLEKRNLNKDAVILSVVPKAFISVLKNITKQLIGLKNISDYILDKSATIAIQTLLYILKKRCPNLCGDFITKLADHIFSIKHENGAPEVLFHRTSSYFVEVMIKVADSPLQLTLFNTYIAEHLEYIVSHSVSNFVVQRLFDTVESLDLFKAMCEKMSSCFDVIYNHQNFGVILSIANACNRLKAEQELFMKYTMSWLNCLEPSERQERILLLLLGLEKYETVESKFNGSDKMNLPICLHGSLVAQSVLKFQKPKEIVKSFLKTPPSVLAFIAGHRQGCHVITAFFESETVSEKSKEKLLNHLKPVIASMACDREQSFTLCRLWVLLSIKLRERMAQMLLESEGNLKSSKAGKIAYHKFGLYHFRKDLSEWKKIQSKLQKTC